MQVYNNVSLSTILWYQIGGVADVVIDVFSKEDLYESLKYLEENNISDIFLIGLGSNMLFPDQGFRGAILRFLNQKDGQGIKKISENIIESFAGETLDSLINYCFDNGLVGLEWAGGLPGTVGAAVRGNVGAFGGEIKDTFYKAYCIRLHEDGSYEEEILNCEEMEFSYRSSRVKTEKLIVVSAQFELENGTPEKLLRAREIYYENILYRQNKHPLDYPNCGSVFKNISKPDEVKKIISVWPDIKSLADTKWHGKVSMGYVIERLELKGYRVGNAMISEKHQNFIVNLGGAKADDVKEIITEVEKKVQDEFGFTPEVEIEIV